MPDSIGNIKTLRTLTIYNNNITSIPESITKLNYLYSSSDIFVASSIQEAFGKTWAESLACGTPFVCFANTAAAGIIKHKIDGYIVNELNSNQLKDGIDWLIENLNKIKDKNDLRKIAEKFDTKKIAEEYIQLYKGLIS